MNRNELHRKQIYYAHRNLCCLELSLYTPHVLELRIVSIKLRFTSNSLYFAYCISVFTKFQVNKESRIDRCLEFP